MLQAIRSNPQQKRVAIGKSSPAPVDGWDAISPLAQMDPKRAIVLDNWFPQPGYVEARKGYVSWSTGMGATTSVETLMCYNGLIASADKLFGIAGGTIYDCTSNAAASSTGVTGLSSSRFQYVNYTTSAGICYLVCCSGVDSPRLFDGSTWTTPTITGVTGSDIINLNVFKKYIWGILANSMDACYLPLDSISGATTKFPLGSVMGKGGYLVAMSTWTRDGGSGPDDYAVFISSRGQVAVYSGLDPDVNFALIGVYEIPPPIGYRCFTRVSGDIAIITIGGVLPLSKALVQDRSADAAIAITLRINNAMNTYAQSYRTNFGWELTPFPLGTMAILNVPVSESITAYQAVMNTLTGAWCRFTGWNMNCFAVFKDNLYAGSNVGVVYKMWTGGIDFETAFTCTGQTAYNYYDQRGIDKRFTALQPLITTDTSSALQVGFSTDFRSNRSLSTPTAGAGATGGIYGTAVWNTDVYYTEGYATIDWSTVSAIGQCASFHFVQSVSSTNAIQMQLNGFNITYEAGEFY